ncbi:AAA family ATPase [Capnocytophaga granulosa]|uniref:AAA family ATPase n=1 Tax=Capnocytophaga granulosa TaxID=45242 RepID=UPI0038573D0C
MTTLPKSIEPQKELDNRLGIKSSLNKLSSMIALSYILYCINSKKATIDYSKELDNQGTKSLVLKPELEQSILQQYEISPQILNDNPLLKSQLEAIQVGLSIMFKLGVIKYIDFPNTDTKERTGGERYRKRITFSTNINILDLYISSWPIETQKEELRLWLHCTPSDSPFSTGLKKLLTIFSEDTLYKLRSQGKEILFQQEGIYNELLQGNNVIAKDIKEDVGAFRVFKSFVKENLQPYLQIDSNEFSPKQDVSILKEYDILVKTSLFLNPKTIKFINDSPKLTEHIDINSHQIIYYGAPGTGKSYKIKEYLKSQQVPKENIFRTTFHPDSDYSTFIGAYKPTMVKQYRYTDNGTKVKYTEEDNLANAQKSDPIVDKSIEYNFVPQTFLNAYIRAYQTQDNVYLVIEEINRGNCAQIFGDLFQLLDRNAEGKSDYTIKADTDLRVYLENILGSDNEGIKDGELCLPSNLYIFATMNTSDQSLFPIDSAFKRRWDWEYEPIKYKNQDWSIIVGSKQYSWVSFQKIVNERIFDSIHSEDKMLGDYFVNPHDGVITEQMLLNKVLFYLWNDVCKEGEGEIFKTSETEEVSFSDLYGQEGQQRIIQMMEYLGVKPFSTEENKNISFTDSNIVPENEEKE